MKIFTKEMFILKNTVRYAVILVIIVVIAFGMISCPDPAPIQYSITITPAENGSVQASTETAVAGSVVTLSIQSESGFDLASLRAQYGSNVDITINILDLNTAAFTMPAGNVTITAEFILDTIRLPYLYPGTGELYNGFTGTAGLRTSTYGVNITYPYEPNFEADGFFTLEGVIDNPATYNYARVSVTKVGEDSTTYYYVRGNFKTRIWLRFGPGDYTVVVSGLSSVTAALNGDGDVTGSSWPESNITGSNITYNVTNTRNEGDMRFIYPSYVVQSDAPLVTDLAYELTHGLTDDVEKIRAIHDYIVANTVYDRDSMTLSQRKKQDALTVLGTRYRVDSQYANGHFLAVCEGYANTFAALARAAGFQVRYVSSTSMNHGWNNIYLDGAWWFVDVTWNDPLRGNAPAGEVDFGPNRRRYDYFLLDSLDGVYENNTNSHTGWEINNRRSLIGSIAPPWQRGVPDGWY